MIYCLSGVRWTPLGADSTLGGLCSKSRASKFPNGETFPKRSILARPYLWSATIKVPSASITPCSGLESFSPSGYTTPSDKFHESFLDELSSTEQEVIKKRKTFYFALEDLKVSNLLDIDKIENIWLVKKTIPYCLKKIK